MTLITLIIQVLLTVPLTLLINYLNKKEVSKTNQLIIPTIYIIIVATLIPQIKQNIYLIVIFEIFIRNFYITNITANQKDYSINVILDSIISSALAIFTYNYFISKVITLIPDPESIKAIVWILVIIYLFSLYKKTDQENIPVKEEKNKQIKKEYIIMQYAKFKNKYFNIVNSKKQMINKMLYSIMIYENTNNPIISRKLEEYIGSITKTETKYGIMRVKSYSHLTDEESIISVLNDLEKISKNKKEKLTPIMLLTNYDEKTKEDILNIYKEIDEFSKK